MSVPITPVALTQKLISFDTINPPGQEADCAHYLGELLDNSGFQVSYHEFAVGRTSLVARRGSQDRPLCFTGHLDTVPLGTQEWTVDPFAGKIRDGRLYGRGSSDMKSGVAAFVSSAVSVGDALDNGPGVVLVITAGEETGCEGAFHLTQASEPLGQAEAVVVAEPTSSYPLAGHKGALWLQLSTHGVTAHGSMPEYGDNAIYKAARIASKLERFEFHSTSHPVLGDCTLNVGNIKGGININSVPDNCQMQIDIRTIPDVDHGDLRDRLTQYLGSELAAMDTVVDLQGIWTETNDPWLREVYEVAGVALNERIEPHAATYFTDASALKPFYGASTVILGPGESSMAHQTDEYCYVSRIEQASRIYTGILEDWANHTS